MRGRSWIQLGAASALALAVAAAYCNSLHGGLVLDDITSLTSNPTILHLWPLSGPLSPPSGTGITVEGRPVLNLSFAINYALGGFWLPGLHLTNLLIHVLATLLAWGICRRVLKNESVAFAMALLWAIHPLQTESVTYIVQRAESLMGLFYLGTVYAFMRAIQLGEGGEPAAGSGTRGWLWLSAICCVLGMGTKEVMVSAPLVVLLVDRTLVAGTCAEALRRRKGYYAGLAASWVLLGALVYHAGNRGNTSGLGVGIGFLHYWATQPYAIGHYLYLVAYPRRLVFDYGTPWVVSVGPTVALHCVLVGTLLVATLRGLWERSIVGLLGFWFFAILAPTSLIPGNRQILAEHRMYVALLPVVLAFGWMLVSAGPRLRTTGVVLALIVCAGFGYRTYARNRVYHSELTLYADTAAKVPWSAFAQENYGAVLVHQGRYWEAEPHLRRALALLPIYPVAEQALGTALMGMGLNDEAERHLKKAIVMVPTYGAPHGNLGSIYVNEGRIKEAIEELHRALELDPSISDAHNNLGSAYASEGRIDRAVAEFEFAVDQMPSNTSYRVNYARALAESGRLADGLRQFLVAIDRDPENPVGYLSYAAILAQHGRDADAATEYEAALRLVPGDAPARLAQGRVLVRLNRLPEAISQLQEAMQALPASAEVHTELALALAKSGDAEEARNQLHTALRLDPNYGPAKQALGEPAQSK